MTVRRAKIREHVLSAARTKLTAPFNLDAGCHHHIIVHQGALSKWENRRLPSSVGSLGHQRFDI